MLSFVEIRQYEGYALSSCRIAGVSSGYQAVPVPVRSESEAPTVENTGIQW